MKRKHPLLIYVLIAVASVAFSVARPPHDLTPESNAIALAEVLTTPMP